MITLQLYRLMESKRSICPTPKNVPHLQKPRMRNATNAFLIPFSFLFIFSPIQNLRRMEGETPEEPVRDLNELQNDDWVKEHFLHNKVKCRN